MLLGIIVAASVAAASPGQFSPADGIIAPAAPTTPATAAPAAAKAKTAANDTICWTEEPVGSHIPHRYCAPRAYWEQRQRMDREALSHQSSGGSSRSTGGGGMSASTSSGGGSAGP
ncbi:MAG: hypothetical protein E7812_17680 [Phenylobacterium sp.]|nr:MAG: hypothetical protein E7812_17680 [Phenylobacterium sp.]